MGKLVPVPNYVLASVAVGTGGFLNGYDTGSIGAVMETPQFIQTFGHLSPFLIGFTVSLIMLTGAVPSVFAGHLADRFGRLNIIMAGTALFLAGALAQGTASTLVQFNVGRALAGLGQGVYLSNMNIYVCEISPVAVRGVLAGVPQLLTTLGVCSGYFTCYGSVRLSSSMGWRTPYVVQAALALVMILSCLVQPESPRWLMMHGKRAKALAAVQRLDISLIEAERDILSATGQQNTSLSPWQGLRLIFKPGYRQRTILALFLLGMAQLSGIDGILYYAPTLFSQAGLSSSTASFLASGLSAILMFAISIPAFLLADKWGRRTSAITGGLSLSTFMLLIGSLYAAGVVHPYGAAKWVVIVCVFAFGLTYCATWAIVAKIYASEIQPSNTRAAANCIAQGLGFFTNWLVAILTPILLDKSAYGAYFLFGGLSLTTVTVLALYMPETRGRSLEDIQEAFQRPVVTDFTEGLRRRLGGRSRVTAPTVSASSRQVLEMDTQGAAPSATGTSTESVGLGMRLDVV